MRSISSVLTVIGTTVVLAVSGVVGAASAPAVAAPTPTPTPASAPDAAAGETVGMPKVSIYASPYDEYRAQIDDTDMDPVRLDIRRAGTTEVVQSLTKFTRGQIEDSSYWTSGLIVLDAVGYYEMDLYAKDPLTGKEGSRSDYAKFFYGPGVNVAVESSRKEFSLDSLGSVASGRATVKDPKTGAQVPVAGARVEVTTDNQQYSYGKTDADGRFSIPFSATGAEQRLVVTARLTDDKTYSRGWEYLKVQQQKAIVTLTGPTADLALPFGDHAVSGKVTRIAGDGTVKPVGAGHLLTGSCTATPSCDSGVPVSGPATAADGSFKVAARVTQPGKWSISTVGSDPWLTTSTPGTFTVAKVSNSTRMTEEKVTVTADGKLTFTGKALLVNPVGTPATSAPIVVESQAEPGGYWSRVRATPRSFGKTFIVTVDVPMGQVAAWRIGVGATKTTSPSTGTKVLKTSKLHTWFAPNSLSSLPKGSPLTMKGTLYTMTPDGAAKPLAGRKVHYFFKADGSTTWKEVSTSTTSETGYYRRSVIPTGSGDWQVRFTDGGATHLNNTTAPDHVAIR